MLVSIPLSLSLRGSSYFPAVWLQPWSQKHLTIQIKIKYMALFRCIRLYGSCTDLRLFGAVPIIPYRFLTPKVPASRCANDTCHALLSARVFQVIIVGRRPSRRRRHADSIQAFSVMWLLKTSTKKWQILWATYIAKIFPTQLSHEKRWKKGTWFFRGFVGDYTTHIYVGIIKKKRCKDPY